MVPPRKKSSTRNGNDADPEKHNPTVARPLAKDPERNVATQARKVEEAARSYHTGQSYSAVEGDDAGLSGNESLEGDGLDALDPELEVSQEDNDDNDATSAGPPMRLEIIAGPDAGKSKRFQSIRMVVGRTAGVDFLLSDQSVSRRHIEFITTDDGVMMKDLGSGNGTKINGTQVAEKLLVHDDEIVIGKTTLRFVDEKQALDKIHEENEKLRQEASLAQAQEAEAPPAEAERGESEPSRAAPVLTTRHGRDSKRKLTRKTQLVLIVVGVVVAIASIAGWVLRPPSKPLVDPNQVLAEQKMQAARNAAREGDFENVVKWVAEAEALIPGIDKSKLASQAQAELVFLSLLDEARTAIASRRFEDARKALAKTRDASVKNEEARSKLLAALEEGEVSYKKEKIDELIASGEIEAARLILAELPVGSQSGPAQKIVEFERQLEKQKMRDAKNSAATARSAAALAQERREQEINDAFVVVERKFGSAEWDRAASECGRVITANPTDKDIVARAKLLSSLIPKFGAQYDEGTKKFRQGNLVQAAKPLKQALQLYRQVNLTANRYLTELEEKIGAAAVVAAQDALLHNEVFTAWQMFKEAQRLDPDDAKARQGLENVARRAEELYQIAYGLKESDPQEAARKFKLVIQVTEPDSSLHERANTQLGTLGP